MTLTKQEELQLKKLIVGAKEKCKEQYGILIEKNFEINTEKTLEENKAIIIQAIKAEKDLKLKDKPVIPKQPVSSTTKNERKEAERKEKEELDKIKEEEKRLLDEFRKETAKTIKVSSFEIPQHFIRMVTKGINNACVLIGEGGIGKSYVALNTIKENVSDFAYLNGYVTPLSLYMWLYKHKDKLCVLDDVSGLFENPNAVSILKSALWSAGDKRIVHYETTSRQAENLPSCFEMQGKFIILGNQMDMKNENILALISRSLFYELNFTHKEKCEIMREIAKTDYKGLTLEQRNEVVEHIIQNSNPTTRAFNFRTLIKGYDFYLYGKDWQTLIKSILVNDKKEAFVWKLMREKVRDSWQIFVNAGYGSRATYFRIKERLECDIGV